MKLNNKEFDILLQFKKMKPWNGDYFTKYEKFKWLLDKLCLAYNLSYDIPKLKIMNDKYSDENGYGNFNFEKNIIELNNFSVITLLHEFKHFLDYKNNIKYNDDLDRENAADYYCYFNFYYIWPERIEKLQEILNIKKNNNLKLDLNLSFSNNNIETKAICDIIKYYV